MTGDASRLGDPHRVGLALLAVTIVGWGLNWPIIKIVLREWPPLFARGSAGVAAALLLAALAFYRGETLAIPKRGVAPLVAASFTNVFAWMGFTNVAMQWVSVAEGALLVYTMPLWVSLLEWPLRGRRPNGTRLLALGLGFGGLLVLLGSDLGRAGDITWIAGVLLALAAAILFAGGTLLLRPVAEIAPLVSTAWQVGLASAAMVLLALLFERHRIDGLSARGALALAYMTVLPMGFCYVSWFAALRRLPAATAAIATLLTPILGIVSAGLLIGEPLGWREAIAAGLTMTGVALALRTRQ